MKYLYLILSMLVFPVFLKAQSNYKPGYVVTLNGDTVKGYILYREWVYNPQRIDFKIAINAPDKSVYSLDNATAFSVMGLESYRRFNMNISNDQTGTNNMSQIIDTVAINRTAFFKVIATGKNATLYAYTDKTKLRFFIAENSQLPVELIYHVYLDPNDATHVMTDTRYKRQFFKLVAKYQPSQQGLYATIQGAEYKYDDMVKVVNSINGVSGLTIQQKAITIPGITFFITAGVNNSSVKLRGVEYLGDVTSKSSIFPLIGGGLNLYLNKNVGRLVFRLESYFTGSKSNLNFTYNASPDQNVVIYSEMISFKMYRLSLAPQLLYNFYNGQQLKFFLAAGFNMQFCSYSDEQYTIISHYSGSSSINDPQTQGQFPTTNPFILNGIGKAGLSIGNKFEIYGAYIPPTGIVHTSYRINLTQYSFGLSYLFGKP